jgi:hypothetical protein
MVLIAKLLILAFRGTLRNSAEQYFATIQIL